MHIRFCPFSVCMRIVSKRIKFPSQSQIFSSKFVKLQHVHLNTFLRHEFTFWWSEERNFKQMLSVLMLLLMLFFSVVITVSSIISYCHPIKCHPSLNYLHIGVKVNLNWLEGNLSWLCFSVFVAKTAFSLGEKLASSFFPLPWAAVVVPHHVRTPQGLWASWMMCVPQCTLWERGLTRHCCRNCRCRLALMNISTAGTRASSSIIMLER